ncbi:MAG: signal recognition particle-docking protein FtsY, partial [Pseudomonadota bacterium]
LATGTLPLDENRLDDIEEALITADLGPAVAGRIRARLADAKFAKGVDEAGLKAAVAAEVTAVLAPVAKPLAITAFPRPHVILVVGVNGSGKTTTIAKLARRFTEQDYTVMLAAGDTFRAAAIAQLKIWAERIGVPVVSGEQGADAPGLAYEALKQAREAGTDVLIIDTAGRLQNKTGLMDELAKMRRVLQKLSPAAPHDTILVLDATTGQNALNQIEVFGDVAKITGLVMTKLDGSARGGVLVAAAEKFRLPIHAVGVGEGMDDLRPFAADDFGLALVGD